MTEGDAAAVRVHVPGFPALVEARVGEELEHDGGEGLVDLDHGHVVPGETRLRERPLAGLRVPMEHSVRVDACETEGDETTARLETQPRDSVRTRDEHRGCAVADLARVTGGDDAVRPERRRQCGKLLGRGVASRRLVDREQRADVRIGYFDGND